MAYKIVLTGDSAGASRNRAVLSAWKSLPAGSTKADLLEAVQSVDGQEETTMAQISVIIGAVKKQMPKVYKTLPALKSGQRGRVPADGASESDILDFLADADDNA